MTFTERELEYIRAHYVPLEQAVQEAIERGVLPRPSYVLPDGTQMVPADYLAPDYDRNLDRFGRPSTRDLLIKAARERFPDVFASRVA